MRLSILLLVVTLVACGSPVPNKTPNGSSNGSSGSNNASTTNSAPNGGMNGGTNGAANGTTGPDDGTNGSSTISCEILTSETESDYCNLQATCGEGTLLAECLLEETWRCFCGADEPVELDDNPCVDPDVYAPDLAVKCGATSTPSMNACESTSFESPEADCAYGVTCADDQQYAVACITDDQTETSECQCFVNGEPTEGFSTDGITCEVGNDDLSWWNSGCGWELSYD